MPNGFMWFDVNAKEGDVEAVTNFYRTVFDGPIGPDDTDSPYMSWMMNGEQPWAAVVNADDVTTGHWCPTSMSPTSKLRSLQLKPPVELLWFRAPPARPATQSPLLTRPER